MTRWGRPCRRAGARSRIWETEVDASCYVMENFCMQAGIALGNIATVLSVPSEEAGIVSELKAGSEEAFNWLIAKYHQPIYSLIARTIPDPADAADLTQDVFIKIYRGIQRIQRRLQPAHLDLSHCPARGQQPTPLVGPPQAPGSHHRDRVWGDQRRPAPVPQRHPCGRS